MNIKTETERLALIDRLGVRRNVLVEKLNARKQVLKGVKSTELENRIESIRQRIDRLTTLQLS